MKHAETVMCVAFSPDGSRIATVLNGETPRIYVAQIWDVLTSAPVGEPMKHKSPIVYVTFNSDASRLQTASGDGKVCIWDAEGLLPKNPKSVINYYLSMKDPSIQRDLEFEDYLRKFVSRKQFLYRSSTAIQSVAKKNWFTAKFHLPWLCEQEPNNPRWKKLLDEVNAASSIHDE